MGLVNRPSENLGAVSRVEGAILACFIQAVELGFCSFGYFDVHKTVHPLVGFKSQGENVRPSVMLCK